MQEACGITLPSGFVGDLSCMILALASHFPPLFVLLFVRSSELLRQSTEGVTSNRINVVELLVRQSIWSG